MFFFLTIKHADFTTLQMDTIIAVDDNPFADPMSGREASGTDRNFVADSTLAVGRDATLTLGTDALIVLGTRKLCSPMFSSTNRQYR